MKVPSLTLAVLSVLTGCTMPHSMRPPYDKAAIDEFARQPLLEPELLNSDDIARLPKTVQRYLHFVGAVGKPKVQNFWLAFDVEMKKAPDARPMIAVSEQYNFMGNPARLFYMKTSMYGIPADGLHAYVDKKASMVIRVASLFNAVDAQGAVLDETETVTVLNDICLMAPAVLVDPRFTFREIDETTTGVTFQNGPHRVSAILYFGKEGELVNFTSEDRSALQDDGSFRKLKFSTPVRSYWEIDGRKVISYGEAVYHYPEGDFTYGKFTMKNIRYNVARPIENQ
jgi:hypothetical protein